MNFFARILVDPESKPSTMRVASMVGVVSGCFILVGGAFGYAPLEVVSAEQALLLVGASLLGKTIQRSTEAKKQIESAKEASHEVRVR